MKFTTSLYKYQCEGVARMHAFRKACGGRTGVLLADSMGLGKTIQVLKYLHEFREALPAVVVCRAGLKRNWVREAKMHAGMSSVVLEGTSGIIDMAEVDGKDLIIVNFEILHAWLPLLQAIKPGLMAIDESQMVSGLNTRRTLACRALDKIVKHRICMSGTPLTDRPAQLWTVLRLCRPDFFTSSFDFLTTYCLSDKQYGGWVFSGARNLPRLHSVLRKTCMIRRTTEEVLPQLPPLVQDVVPLAISRPDEYQAAESDYVAWLSAQSLEKARRAARALRLTRHTGLKGLAAKLKRPGVLDWVSAFLDESDDKLLIGCIHPETVEVIWRHAGGEKGKAVFIHGGTSLKKRAEAEDLFQNDPSCRVLSGQMDACGVGHNFTAANRVAIVELGWSPGTHVQLIKRAHRIGTKRSVHATFLVAEGTIEEDVCRIIQSKQGTLDQVLDGVSVRGDSLTILDQLDLALLAKYGHSRCAKGGRRARK